MAKDTGALNMTEGSPMRILIRFSMPLLAGNLLQQCYNLADSAIAGRWIGMGALSAVSNGYMIVLLITTFFSGLSVGGTILIAQFRGKNDPDGIRRTADAVYFGIGLLCIPVMVTGLFASGPLLRLFNVPEEILPDALNYVQVIFLGLPGGMGYNVNAGILNGLGDSRVSLWFLALSCVLNLALDLLFVAGLSMGVFGTALATVLSQYVSALCGIGYMNKRYAHMMHIGFPVRGVDRQLVKKALRVGIPSSFSGLQYTVGMMLIQALINSCGIDFIAGVNAASRIDGLVFMPILSFSSAASTFAAQNMGAGRIDRVRAGNRAGLILSVSVCLVLSALIVPFGRGILQKLFSLTDRAADSGMAYLYCVMAPGAWLGVSYVLNGTLRGVGCVMTAAVSGIVSLWAVRLPAAYLLTAWGGPGLMFLSYPIGWTAGIVISAVCYRSGRWEGNDLTGGGRTS